MCESAMVLVYEELIGEHLKVVEICEDGQSIVVGDLPLIQVSARADITEIITIEKGISVESTLVKTSVGVAEVEIYHVMGIPTAISFILRLKGCGHNLRDIYSAVLEALKRGSE